MPDAHRPPRAGDLLAVRTSDRFLPETQVVIRQAVHDGRRMTLTGTWGDLDLEVVLLRVGDTHP